MWGNPISVQDALGMLIRATASLLRRGFSPAPAKVVKVEWPPWPPWPSWPTPAIIHHKRSDATVAASPDRHAACGSGSGGMPPSYLQRRSMQIFAPIKSGQQQPTQPLRAATSTAAQELLLNSI